MLLGEVAPGGHAYPAEQLPLQVAVFNPGELPKRPAGHSVHTLAPSKLYRPVGQGNCVGLEAPPVQNDPAEQLPVHSPFVSPVVFP